MGGRKGTEPLMWLSHFGKLSWKCEWKTVHRLSTGQVKMQLLCSSTDSFLHISLRWAEKEKQTKLGFTWFIPAMQGEGCAAFTLWYGVNLGFPIMDILEAFVLLQDTRCCRMEGRRRNRITLAHNPTARHKPPVKYLSFSKMWKNWKHTRILATVFSSLLCSLVKRKVYI